jgi:hypothetical protein
MDVIVIAYMEVGHEKVYIPIADSAWCLRFGARDDNYHAK